MGTRLAATPLGFFTWGLNDPASQGVWHVLADGWTWSDANPIGPWQIVDVVADGDHLLALGAGRVGRECGRGTIDGQQLIVVTRQHRALPRRGVGASW